ncbi:hypothetical protein HZH66_014911 [Vespula vulgaris]|uniref:Uncharacterized protein n=1 Tax=Vespula vulgaris TaxID=7454 RepID=A0A834J0I1_VESVU|nr:hypothetical protein HZH66_014911 [Vespula vulgaris]
MSKCREQHLGTDADALADGIPSCIDVTTSIVGSDHSDHYAKRYRSVNDKVGNKRKLPRPSCNYTANRKVIYCLELELAGTRKQQGVPR